MPCSGCCLNARANTAVFHGLPLNKFAVEFTVLIGARLEESPHLLIRVKAVILGEFVQVNLADKSGIASRLGNLLHEHHVDDAQANIVWA